MRTQGISRLPYAFAHRDPDALAAELSRRFSPLRIETFGPRTGVDLTGIDGLGPGLDFSVTHCKTAFRLIQRDVYDGVLFLFPKAGLVSWNDGRNAFSLGNGRAMAMDSRLCRWISFSSDLTYTRTMIAQERLNERLAVLLDAPVAGRITFEPVLDMQGSAAAALFSLVGLLTEPEFSTMLKSAPATAGRLMISLIDLALETWPHTFSDQLRRKPPLIAPRHVKLALECIREAPRAMPTPEELAAVCGVSLRALQHGFQHFVGTSVGAYQRQIRLEGARVDLVTDPNTSIEEVALRWGFTNAGRFSRYFRAAFGVYPSAVGAVRRGQD